MLKKPKKAEIYIIALALILSAITISGFWIRSQPFSNSILAPSPMDDPTQTMAETESEGTSEARDEEKQIASKIESENTESLTGLSKITEPGQVSALVLGDMIAASEGASNKDQSSWTTYVAKDLQAMYPGTIEWNFRAGKDFTVYDIFAELPEINTNSDLILICLGRADSSYLALNDFKLKYRELIQEIQIKLPQADIVLIAEPPVKNIQNNNQFFPYRQVILDLGNELQLPVIDEWQTFIDDPAPLASLLSDGVYPNDSGYRIFADTVTKRFNEYLVSKP